MKVLSKPQWSMLERSSQEPVSVNENMNTMASLYARSLIRFIGPAKRRTIVPTKLGSTYLHNRKQLKSQPSFNETRALVREYR